MGGRPGALTGSPAGDAGVTAAPLLGDRLTADHTVDSTLRSQRAESDVAGHAVLEGLHRKSYKYPRGCVRNRSSFLLQRGSRLAIASIKHTNLGRLQYNLLFHIVTIHAEQWNIVYYRHNITPTATI